MKFSLFADTRIRMTSAPFGERLKQVRQGHAYSLMMLAKPLGISQTYLWEIEKGERRPLPLHRLVQLKQILDLTEDETAELVYLATRDARGLLVQSHTWGSQAREIIQEFTRRLLKANGTGNGKGRTPREAT